MSDKENHYPIGAAKKIMKLKWQLIYTSIQIAKSMGLDVQKELKWLRDPHRKIQLW